jgi:hypothetical protein
VFLISLDAPNLSHSCFICNASSLVGASTRTIGPSPDWRYGCWCLLELWGGRYGGTDGNRALERERSKDIVGGVTECVRKSHAANRKIRCGISSSTIPVSFPRVSLSALDHKARCVVIPIFSTSKENSQSSVPVDQPCKGISPMGGSMVEYDFIRVGQAHSPSLSLHARGAY